MAYATIHQLFTAHGGLPSGEVWSCGIRATGLLTQQADLDAMTQAFADRWSAMATTLATSVNHTWSPGTGFDGVTGRVVSAAGVTILQSERSPATPINYGTVVNKMPTQAATVVTLLTAAPGRTGKGRIYLPLLGHTLNTNARITNISTISVAVKTFMDTLHTAWFSIGGDRLAVASQGGNNSSPVTRPIVGIRVGDVVDTQRRRRDSIAENYSNQLLAAAP